VVMVKSKIQGMRRGYRTGNTNNLADPSNGGTHCHHSQSTYMLR